MIRNWQKRGRKNMVILIDTNVALDFLAMREPFSDFEDCLQDECAKEVLADFIVTRNVGDFQCSKVKAIKPHDFLELVNS